MEPLKRYDQSYWMADDDIELEMRESMAGDYVSYSELSEWLLRVRNRLISIADLAMAVECGAGGIADDLAMEIHSAIYPK